MDFLFSKNGKLAEYNEILFGFFGFRIYVTVDPDFPKDTLDVVLSKIEPTKKFYSLSNLLEHKYLAFTEGMGTLFGINRNHKNVVDKIVNLYSGREVEVFESLLVTKKFKFPTFSSPSELKMKFQLLVGR